jgi:hypothetical protein
VVRFIGWDVQNWFDRRQADSAAEAGPEPVVAD